MRMDPSVRGEEGRGEEGGKEAGMGTVRSPQGSPQGGGKGQISAAGGSALRGGGPASGSGAGAGTGAIASVGAGAGVGVGAGVVGGAVLEPGGGPEAGEDAGILRMGGGGGDGEEEGGESEDPGTRRRGMSGRLGQPFGRLERDKRQAGSHSHSHSLSLAGSMGHSIGGGFSRPPLGRGEWSFALQQIADNPSGAHGAEVLEFDNTTVVIRDKFPKVQCASYSWLYSVRYWVVRCMVWCTAAASPPVRLSTQEGNLWARSDLCCALSPRLNCDCDRDTDSDSSILCPLS